MELDEPQNPLTLLERDAFFSRCERNDWYYWAIDDGAKFRWAEERYEALAREAKSHPDKHRIWMAFANYIANCTAMVATDTLPRRPRLREIFSDGKEELFHL